MKRIDIHCHVAAFPEWHPLRHADNDRMLGAEEQIEVHGKLGVTMGVILPIVSPEAQLEMPSNREAKIVADKYPDRFVWFCNIDPRSEKYSVDTDLEYQVNFYKNLGARGLGELTTNIPADDPMMDNLFGACERQKMPVLIHIGHQVGGCYGIVDELGLPRIERMLKKHPDMIMIGHSQTFWAEISAENNDELRKVYPGGKVSEGNLARLLRDNGNLYCDLSAGSGRNAMKRDPEYAARFLEEFSDRILYGTDVCGTKNVFQYDFMDFMNEMVEKKMLTEENYEKIMYKNAAKLLGIE